MQGFVGQRAFTVKRQPDSPSGALVNAEKDATSIIEDQRKDESAEKVSNFLITLISRRSTKRPGLRYLRRVLKFPSIPPELSCYSTLHLNVGMLSPERARVSMTVATQRTV